MCVKHKVSADYVHRVWHLTWKSVFVYRFIETSLAGWELMMVVVVVVVVMMVVNTIKKSSLNFG